MTGFADRSSFIVAAGVPQQLVAARPSRQGLSIQNTSSGDLFFKMTDTNASSSDGFSKKLIPNAYYETPSAAASKGRWSIVGATINQTFTAEEW